MTPHDQISAYIDNELGAEQEQDFLISLASSDGLRKSFRSELVLKNVIHRDEVLTTPSRDMRGAVLTTLGIVGASAIASETADAATAVTATKGAFLKTMFASKLNALVTATMVTASALGGYAVRTIIADKPAPATVTAPTMQNTQPVNTITSPCQDASTVTNVADQSHESAPKKNGIRKNTAVKTSATNPVETTDGVKSGTGGVTVNPPDLSKPKK